MPATYIPIASQTLGSAAASVTFSSIPQAYTDLVLRFSARTARAGQPFDSLNLTINGTGGTAYSETALGSFGTTTTSSRTTSQAAIYNIYTTGATATADTFANGELYFPNYLVATNKPIGIASTAETNSTDTRLFVVAGLWQNTAAITSITLTGASANISAGSSFYLYGIKKD